MSKIEFRLPEFKETLSIVGEGLGKGTVLPITKFLRMRIDNNKVKITATNLKKWVEVQTTMTGNAAPEPIEVLVEGQRFINMVKTLNTDTLVLGFKEDSVDIITENGSYTFEVLEAEFPKYEFNKDEAQSLKVDIKELWGMVQKVGSVRPNNSPLDVLETVQLKDGFISSSDSYTWITGRLDTDIIDYGSLGELLITKDGIDILKLFNKDVIGNTCTIYVDKNKEAFYIEAGEFSAYAPLYTGAHQFPDSNAIMVGGDTNEALSDTIRDQQFIKLPTKELKETLKELKAFHTGSDHKYIIIEATEREGQQTLTIKDNDMGMFHVELEWNYPENKKGQRFVGNFDLFEKLTKNIQGDIYIHLKDLNDNSVIHMRDEKGSIIGILAGVIIDA